MSLSECKPQEFHQRNHSGLFLLTKCNNDDNFYKHTWNFWYWMWRCGLGMWYPKSREEVAFTYRVRGQWRMTSGTLKADSHITCRAHAVPLPCRAVKGLECVLPIWFTQCGRVWFTLSMPRPCHALTMPWPWEERHGQWARHGKCESDTAALCKSNRKDTF
jgi:hypothetical protein